MVADNQRVDKQRKPKIETCLNPFKYLYGFLTVIKRLERVRYVSLNHLQNNNKNKGHLFYIINGDKCKIFKSYRMFSIFLDLVK